MSAANQEAPSSGVATTSLDATITGFVRRSTFPRWTNRFDEKDPSWRERVQQALVREAALKKERFLSAIHESSPKMNWGVELACQFVTENSVLPGDHSVACNTIVSSDEWDDVDRAAVENTRSWGEKFLRPDRRLKSEEVTDRLGYGRRFRPVEKIRLPGDFGREMFADLATWVDQPLKPRVAYMSERDYQDIKDWVGDTNSSAAVPKVTRVTAPILTATTLNRADRRAASKNKARRGRV